MPYIPTTQLTQGSTSLPDPVQVLFGSPNTAYEFQSSSLSGLTALSPVPDVEDANTTVADNYYLKDNTGTNAAMGRYSSVPATPYTGITKITDHTVSRSFNLCGIFLGVATPGALQTFGPAYSTVGYDTLSWTSPTDSTPSSVSANTNYPAVPAIWLAIRVNTSTSVDYLISHTGYMWIPTATGINPGFTIASMGIFIAAINTFSLNAAFDYLRIWNSSLTFPGQA